MTIEFRKALQNLAPYPPGKPIEQVQREYGLTRIIKLASNENPLGPSPLAVEAVKRELSEAHLYPESNCYYVREKLAHRLQVPASHVLFGNGSDEIVAMLCLAYLEPHHNIVCSDLAFIRYEMGATMMGAETRHVPMKNWRHDVAGFAAAIDSNTRFVFFSNPNNPVGTYITHVEVEQLLQAVPRETLVVIDEAYYEYAVSESNYPRSLELWRRHPNVIITRTFSKAYGLAGFRIGYAIAQPEIWDPVDRVRPPFNVSRVAQSAALAALDDAEHLSRTVAVNSTGRAFLCVELEKLKLSYVPTAANFILFDVGRPAMPVYEALLRQGVICRPLGVYKLPNHLRVTIGLPEENQIFIDALREALKSA